MKGFLALLCIGTCTTALAAEAVPTCRLVPPIDSEPIVDFSGTLPIPDYLDSLIDCKTKPHVFGKPLIPLPDRPAGQPTPNPPSTVVHPAPLPPDPWMDAERDLYQGILARQKADLLVVPFQTQGYGLDRIERSLMTADLAYRLGNSGKYSVADPWLVARALGDGLRRIDEASVQSLASALGAREIIYAYVGHDRNHYFTVTLQLRDLHSQRPDAQKLWQHDWRAVAFTDEETPAVKFHQMLSEVVSSLPLGITIKPAKSPAGKPRAPIHLDVSLRDLAAATNTPIPAFATLDLLGSLSQTESELPREHLFERAVLNAWNATGDDAQKRFFEAYAMFSLGRRPTTLQLLAHPTGARDSTLRALADGDLLAAQKSIAEVPDSLERLLLQISTLELERLYGRKPKTAPEAGAGTFGRAQESWQPLVMLRVNDLDPWAETPPLLIKSLLDWLFPEGGLDAASLERGAAAGRGEDVDDVELDLANVRHIRRAASHLASSACCTSRVLQLSRWDLLRLVEGLSEGRIIKSLWRMQNKQARAEDTLATISRYEPLMGGLPSMEAVRCTAAGAIAEKSPDDLRAGWIAKSTQAAAIAAQWAPGLNQVSEAGALCMGIPSPASRFITDAYDHDYPPHPGLGGSISSYRDTEQRTAAAIERLAFSSWDFSPLDSLPPGKEADAVMASLGNRFNGNPRWTRPNVSVSPSRRTDPRQAFREAIEADPESWQNYWSLGSIILESGGSFTEVSDVFMSYPGFHDNEPDDAVALSNYAYLAGGVLYADGMLELSKPFFKISADLDTGSYASIDSKIRLETMAGDFPGAAADLLECATRYPDAFGYRDYLSYLHASGHSKEAWSAFAQLDASFQLPAVWASALVGHRMQASEDTAIRKWLRRPEIRDARFKASRFASYYAVLWSAVDRIPPMDLGRLVEELDGGPVGHSVSGGFVLVPHPEDPKASMPVFPSAFRTGKKPVLPEGTPVKSELAYFADALAAVRAGNYDLALTRFDAMADVYPIESYPLPYFAYAAVKTGDREHLEKYIDTPQSRNASFYHWLASAVFAGGHHDLRGAQQALLMALRQRTTTLYEPVPTEYAYAEVCEWVYQETGDARFVGNLLEWVKAQQLIRPTQAWPYTMQYTYEKPGPARVRALALAHYLDPKSPRIKGASANELREAAEWFKTNNPFRLETAAVPATAAAEITYRRTLQ